MVIRDVRDWHDVIQQWDVSDAGMVVLKDWPKEWYQGSMKKIMGSLYSQHKKIAEEYEWCVLCILVVIRSFLNYCPISLGRNDDVFQMTYPAADRSVKALLTAIRVLHNECRQSKNGTPQE